MLSGIQKKHITHNLNNFLAVLFCQLTGLQEENSLSTEECMQLLEAGFPLEHDQCVSSPIGTAAQQCFQLF